MKGALGGREGGREGGWEWKKGEEVEEGEEREEIEEGEECGKVRKRDRECKGGGGGIKRERGNGERREKVFISFIPALMANITNNQQQKNSTIMYTRLFSTLLLPLHTNSQYPWHLYQPANIVTVHHILHCPGGQPVPLIR